MKLKIKYYSPIFIFIVFTLILGIIIGVFYQFSAPDYYIDKKAAFEMINSSLSISHADIDAKYSNPLYLKQNALLQSFLFVLTLMLVSICFRFNSWKDFFQLDKFSNKKFVYLFVNLSYPIWAFFEICSYMVDLDKYVYPAHADSMGIPLFNAVFSLTFLGLMYFPLLNFFTFIIYNTKITNWFYVLMPLLPLAAICIFWYSQLTDCIFSWVLLPQYFIYVIAIGLILASIKFQLHKRKLSN